MNARSRQIFPERLLTPDTFWSTENAFIIIPVSGMSEQRLFSPGKMKSVRSGWNEKPFLSNALRLSVTDWTCDAPMEQSSEWRRQQSAPSLIHGMFKFPHEAEGIPVHAR